MADGAEWPRRPGSLGELVRTGGRLLAWCGAPSCGSATPLDGGALAEGGGRSASVDRLEDHLRCSCGGRGGKLQMWPADLALPAAGGGRVYLFHT